MGSIETEIGYLGHEDFLLTTAGIKIDVIRLKLVATADPGNLRSRRVGHPFEVDYDHLAVRVGNGSSSRRIRLEWIHGNLGKR